MNYVQYAMIDIHIGEEAFSFINTTRDASRVAPKSFSGFWPERNLLKSDKQLLFVVGLGVCKKVVEKYLFGYDLKKCASF